jgi:hypothetical protein
MSDERLDRLIDEVARQMTDGHPSGDFRARVIANLDRRPGRVLRPIWIVAPLGTLAVAVLLVLVARPFSPSALHRMQRAMVDTPKREDSRAAATVQPDNATVRLKADTTYEDPRGKQVAAAGRRKEPSSGAAAIAALAPARLDLAPLGINAMGVDALRTDSIAVPRLDAIAPIAVDPLPTDYRP